MTTHITSPFGPGPLRLGVTLSVFSAVLNLLAAPLPVERYVEGELLVKFRGGPKGADARFARGQMGHQVKRDFDLIGWQHIRLPKGMTVEEGLAKYRKLPQVLAVEPNGIERIEDPVAPPAVAGELETAQVQDVTSQQQNPLIAPSAGRVPNDPQFSTQWNLRLVGMTNAWAVSTGSRDVVIAVLDSGIDYTHEDLRDNMWRNPGETGLDDQGRDKATNGIDDDGNGYIDDVYGIDAVDEDSDPMDLGDGRPAATGFFHGTACAGIIGATGNNGVGVAGVNWAVRLMAIRVTDTNNSISFAAHLEGVEYVLEMRQRGINVRVSNHSYGGSTVFNPLFHDAGVRLQEAGVLQVNAAMNAATDMDQLSRSPANEDLPALVNVAATESSDGLASYSNFGRSTVDLAAPGTYPPTTQPANRYTTSVSGTSFAAPHVAGAAGLLAAVKPDATVWEIRAALMQSVDQTPSLTNKVATHGRLNVGRAVQVLTSDSLPPMVVAVTPTSSRTHQNQRLEVWFSQPMDRASVEAAFEINPPVPGSFQWSDDSRSFQLVRSEPFTWTNHTARIRGTARSMAGLTLDGNYNRVPEGDPADDYVWTFRFAPRNDDFEDAQVIVGQAGSVAGNTYNTSWQLYEAHNAPVPFKDGKYPGDLWYRWTAIEDAWLTFEVSSPTPLDTSLDVQTGDDVTLLNMVAANDDYGTGLSGRVSFAAKAGTNYSIAVMSSNPGDFNQAMGPFSLRWYPTPAPSLTGIGFAPTSGYSGQPVTFTGTNFTGATRVLFNGASATFTNALTNNADLRITAIIPDHATTGPVTIETPHGNVTTFTNFTVLLRPTIASRNLPGANQVELSWPLGAFSLQRASSLTATSAWTSAPGVTRLTNGIRYVTVTNDAPNRFFRLYRP